MSTRISAARAAMRKAPRQARSHATVAAIVEAGARILGLRGWAGFTTNEVAEVAGVSIGSLYQYFPNKLALADAILRRHLDDVLAVLRRAGEGRDQPAQLIEDLVGGMIAIHCINPALHRVLVDLPAPAEARLVHEAFQAEYQRRYADVITVCRGGEAEPIVAQVLSSAVEGVIHNSARRGLLETVELRRELVRLVEGYLGDTPSFVGEALRSALRP
jgi:AcrR family transcriptional regulator